MPIQILTICGAGVGTSAILKVSAERALATLGIDAQVTATDAEHVQGAAEDVQVILSTVEHVAAIGRSSAQIIVIDHILDQNELIEKLQHALG